MKRKAQVWIETVIYVLIGLVVIGIVLAVATPAIDRYKDRLIVEQTISALETLNKKILEVQEAPYNRRVVEFKLQKGGLIFDAAEDKIKFLLEASRLEYSEPGAVISQGSVKILTEKKAAKNDISIFLDYSGGGMNLILDSGEDERTFSYSPTPYKIEIENLGVADGKIQISLKVQ